MYYRKNLIKRLAVTAPIIFIMLTLCSAFYFSSSTDGYIKCFSVDSDGTLYIGKPEKIEVWSKGHYIRTIKPQTSRSYVFRVQEDDTILLSTSTIVYTMDLYGNVLKTEEDRGTTTFNKIQSQNRKGISDGENAYKQRGGITWPRIVKNGNEVVYRVSLRGYLASVALDFAWAIVGVYAIYEIIRFLMRSV